MPIFRKSIFRTNCDECRAPFTIDGGGVCEQCRRILCSRHLHGSILRRLRTSMGAPAICVRCRAGLEPIIRQ